MVGRVAHGRAELAEVPGGRRYLYALSWADSDHVVVERLTHTGEVFYLVDVRTGTRSQLTTTGYQETGSVWFGVQLATDALHDPITAPAVEPPRPWNPRWVTGGTLAALVFLGAVGLLLRSRRVRR